jgi:hypothetical protein
MGWQVLIGSNKDGTIDFGKWEGPVYSFTPDHPNGLLIKPPKAA